MTANPSWRHCPDGARCWHDCTDDAVCWRVGTCEPMSGTRTNDQWNLTPLPDPTAPQAGKVGSDHPDTSRRAAHLMVPRSGSQRAKVLNLLWARWQNYRAGHVGVPGLTCAEVADALGMSRNQCATRFLELREQGWVEYVTEDRFPGLPTEARTEGENTARLQVLTTAGAQACTRRAAG